ncbi:MAG: PilN domain-containing protein, partial [Dehalococcoidales bacterium]|nr:PilN domain-containing protein [Dehalococcoidales bacterium]
QEIIASTETLKAANQSILGNRGDYTSNLQLVTEVLPPQTYFTSIEIDNNRIIVRGETDSVFTVIDYATALEAINTFSEVRITELDEASPTTSEAEETETTPGGGNVITFEIIVNK